MRLVGGSLATSWLPRESALRLGTRPYERESCVARRARPLAVSHQPTMAGRFDWCQWAVTKRARACFAWPLSLFASARLAGRTSEAAVSVDSMPDNLFQLVFAACSDEINSRKGVHHDSTETISTYIESLGVPRFEAVKGLGCLSMGMRQQLHRLRPLVGVTSRAIVERPAHGPWRAVLTVHTDFSPSTKRRPRGTSPSEDEQAQFKKQCKMP